MEGSDCGLFSGIIPEIEQRNLGKSRKSSVKIVGVGAEIRNGHLPDTCQ
jgi:hypothetical protein